MPKRRIRLGTLCAQRAFSICGAQGLNYTALYRQQRERAMSAVNISEYQAITRVMQHYIDGARSGRGDDMKPAFHADATIFGYVGDDLFAGPIQNLFDWNDENGPARDIVCHITNIEIVGTAASVRLESDNWTGHRFTDFFNLVKIDGEWKIMNKIFHLHA